MNKSSGTSYIDQMLAMLAEYGVQAHIHTPDGGVRGVDSRILVIDDFSSIDFSKLEERIIATHEKISFIGHLPQMSTLKELQDFHVIQRKRVAQAKHWETKAALKSRMLRNRQKGK